VPGHHSYVSDTRGFLGLAATLGVDMPLLRAVVTTNDRLTAVMNSEVEGVTQHAAQQAVVDAGQT
jgi:UDPglucose 6-dehydrogenase